MIAFSGMDDYEAELILLRLLSNEELAKRIDEFQSRDHQSGACLVEAARRLRVRREG